MKTSLKTTIFGLAGFFLFFMFSPFLRDIKVSPYRTPFGSFTGPLEVNTRLSEADRLFDGIIDGPESMVFHDGFLYTGLEDGRIVKIKNGEIITVADIGNYYTMKNEKRKELRPLGMKKGKDGLLYFCDLNHGILTMNFTTGALKNIIPPSFLVEGQKVVFPDDLDIDDEGNIYFTDSTTKWDVLTLLLIFLENEAGGRVIRYNMHSRETEVLAKNLHFPNGLHLSKDGKSLLVCELITRRILRLYIKGEKKGKMEIFADNLPGEPDNIIPSSSGGYWVGFFAARNFTNPLILDRLPEYPNFTRFYFRIHFFFLDLLVKLSEFTDNHAFINLAKKLKRGDYFWGLLPLHGIIIEFDENGKILRSFHSPDGKISLISEVQEHDGHLYLGSFINSYLGRLRL